MKGKLIASLLVLSLVCTLTGCGLEVPRPEVKEGRFDLSITYQIGSEIETLSMVYVCEFAGTSWTLEGGYFSRDWKCHTEGDYEGDDYSAIVGRTEDGGEIIVFFGIYVEYFMGDPEIGDRGIPEPFMYISYTEDGGDSYSLVNDSTELEEVYGVKLISYEYDEPIENSFSIFNF